MRVPKLPPQPKGIKTMQHLNCVYPTPNGPALCVPALTYGPQWYLGAVSTCQQHCKLGPQCILPTPTTKAARVTRAPVPGKPATPAQARARARAHAPSLSNRAAHQNLGRAINQYLWAQARAMANNAWVQHMWPATK